MADVLRHEEDHENSVFLPRATSVAAALAAFEDFLHRDKRPNTILITTAGHRSERPARALES